MYSKKYIILKHVTAELLLDEISIHYYINKLNVGTTQCLASKDQGRGVDYRFTKLLALSELLYPCLKWPAMCCCRKLKLWLTTALNNFEVHTSM